MRLHPLKYDFLKTNEKDKKIISAKKEELSVYNTVPLFYVERNDVKHYFGNVYKYEGAYYFLLPFKHEKNINSFYGYKMFRLFLNPDRKNELTFYNDYAGLIAHFEYNRNLLFTIFDKGEYVGNLYLHDTKKIIKEIKDDFGKYVTKPMIHEILNNHAGYEISFIRKVIAERVNNVDLYFSFDEEVLNLNNLSDWDKLFDYKDKPFNLKIQLSNGYKFMVETELKNLFNQKNLEYGLEERDAWDNIHKDLKTGSFLIGQYSSTKLLEHLNSFSKDGVLSYSLNSIHSISFTLEERIKHINYFKELIIVIDDAGYPIIRSINDDEYCLERPFVNVIGSQYKVVNTENKKEYNEHLLKLLA